MKKDFLSKETILLAYHEAMKSRKHTNEWYIFKLNEEENLLRILQQLQNKTYVHWPYKRIVITDSKKRYINSPTLQDHILHHMVYQHLYKVLDKRMCHNTYATRKGKWLHTGIDYFCKKLNLIENNTDLSYMKIDVSKYFYSIIHEKLKEKLFKYIHNTDMQYCISLTIDSYKTSHIFDDMFPEDSIYRQTNAKWLPIWAIYSQIFANFYLYDIDRYINQQVKPLIYMRYMDDMIFVDTMPRLLEMKEKVIPMIIKQWLCIVPQKVCSNTLTHGINLLWWRICIKNGKIIRHVGKNNKKKLRKSIDAMKNLDMQHFWPNEIKKVVSSIEARKSHFHHTKSPEKYLRGYMIHTWSIIKEKIKRELPL
jgi:RNA-directed DNA polymerase